MSCFWNIRKHIQIEWVCVFQKFLKQVECFLFPVFINLLMVFKPAFQDIVTSDHATNQQTQNFHN